MEGDNFDELQPSPQEGKMTIGSPSVKPEVQPEQPKEENQGPLDYINQGFVAFWGRAKDLGGKAKEKIEEAKIGEKLSSAATVVSTKAIAAGSYVKDKTVEIAVVFIIIIRIVRQCKTSRLLLKVHYQKQVEQSQE